MSAHVRAEAFDPPGAATASAAARGVSALLQRKRAYGGAAAGAAGKCDDCESKRLARSPSANQSAAASSREAGRAAPLVAGVLGSAGQSLDAGARALMETRLGHDFSHVRVHTGAQAAQSARAVNALAYTVGQQIVFDVNQYQPSTSAGRRLLAHELTHVVQQQGGRSNPSRSGLSTASSEHEREADRIAEKFDSREPLPPPRVRTGNILARQPAGNDDKEEKLPEHKPEIQPFQPMQSASAEREREVEAVKVGDKKYVLYQKEVLSEGSSAWLANNPGNMDYTEDTEKWGAYSGKHLMWGVHRFAIFPTEAQGLFAVRSFLRKHQRERNISHMMNMFAPAGDLQNDPEGYAGQVAKALGVPVTTLVKNMSDAQIAAFAKAIQVVEGWKPGKSVPRGDSSLPEEIRKRT